MSFAERRRFMKALFLSHRNSLALGGGGQQQCTREYIDTLRAASFDLSELTYVTDRSLPTRIRRRINPKPYAYLFPPNFVLRVTEEVSRLSPSFVFCNLVDFLALGPTLRERLDGSAKLVLLSHGLASVDYLHTARIASHGALVSCVPRLSDQWIGQTLREEAEGLAAFDHVFCLAEFEVEICRWLGARSVSWIPRTMRTDQFVTWKPSGERVGCVGTLDHPPNLEGAELLCEALQAIGTGKLRLRLVTHSRAISRDLCNRYSFVDDLGPLDSAGEMEAEAATWNAFVHPIFCYARGCSTKVATALSWGLPILTTAAGLRGYVWKDGKLPVSGSPKELARLVLAVLQPACAASLREETFKIVRSSPSLLEVGNQIRRDLSPPEAYQDMSSYSASNSSGCVENASKNSSPI